MVADAIIYHPSVAHYLRYIATTVGRDKLLRTLQYFSRFYAWYLLRTNGTPAQIKPFEVIKKQFGLSRKLLRVGKNVEHFKAAATAADQKGGDSLLKYCAVGRQLAYGVYLSLDTVSYLDTTGIRSLPAPTSKRLLRAAQRAWLTGLLFNTISGIYTLIHLSQKSRLVNKTDGEGVVEGKKIERERAAARLQLLSDLCDMTVPGTALGFVGLDDGVVGIAGTVSSLIGMVGVWRKTA
ncbi:MAG: Peroxisomal membrane protein PMP27 [Cirrosporium novae-zelandiae]|nr:MAG: Peroxisomal membrane protein PMP27 [Cirrosporium novae-zelandiae]